MGSGYSHIELSLQQFTTCYLTMNFKDVADSKLLLLQADQKTSHIIREACTKLWPSGVFIQNSTISMNHKLDTVEMMLLKLNNETVVALKDEPFEKMIKPEGETVFQRLCCAMLGDLFDNGWRLLLSADLIKFFHTSAWMFERQELRSNSSQICCITLAKDNQIRLVGGPEIIRQIIRQAIAKNWARGLAKELEKNEVMNLNNEENLYHYTHFVLHGRPWEYSATDNALLQSRLIILEMVCQLALQSWIFYASINPQTLLESSDALFFRKEENLCKDNLVVIAFSKTNSPHLVHATVNFCEQLRVCLEKHWPSGLKRVDENDPDLFFQEYGTVKAFRFRENPWQHESEDGVTARILILRIFQDLLILGWRLVSTIDLSKRADDYCFFLFESCTPKKLPLCAVTFIGGDRLRLLNASPAVVQHFRDKIVPLWPKGIEIERGYNKAWEFRMNGMPFPLDLRNGYQRMRGLISFILQEMRYEGWELLFGANLSVSWTFSFNHRLQDLDPFDHYTWVFCQDARFVKPLADDLNHMYDYHEAAKKKKSWIQIIREQKGKDSNACSD